MLKLFHCPGSCSTATMIALEEAGADYETVIVDLMSDQQSDPAYLAINPKAKVPALVTDQGVLTENPAILLYVAMTYPDAGLAPLDNPYELGRINSFNGFIASTLQPSGGPAMRPFRYINDEAQYPAVATKAKENLCANLDLIESEMLVGPWVLGERYSLSDAYLFPFSAYIVRLSLDAGRYPRILAHRERMLERPAVKKASAA